MGRVHYYWDVQDSVCGRCLILPPQTLARTYEQLLGKPILWLVGRHHVGDYMCTRKKDTLIVTLNYNLVRLIALRGGLPPLSTQNQLKI